MKKAYRISKVKKGTLVKDRSWRGDLPTPGFFTCTRCGGAYTKTTYPGLTVTMQTAKGERTFDLSLSFRDSLEPFGTEKFNFCPECWEDIFSELLDLHNWANEREKAQAQ
jgi:hypothetical protein